MRTQLITTLLAAGVVMVIALGAAGAVSPGRDWTPRAVSATEADLLKLQQAEADSLARIERQLRTLNRSVGRGSSSGLRRQVGKVSAALATLGPMQRSLEAIRANTAFEELP